MIGLGLESPPASDLHIGLRCDSQKGESFVSASQQARKNVERLSALDKATCTTAHSRARSGPRLSYLRSEPKLEEFASSCEDKCQRLSKNLRRSKQDGT